MTSVCHSTAGASRRTAAPVAASRPPYRNLCLDAASLFVPYFGRRSCRVSISVSDVRLTEATDARPAPRGGVIDQSSSPRRTRARMMVLYDSLPRPRRSISAAAAREDRCDNSAGTGSSSASRAAAASRLSSAISCRSELDAARLGRCQCFLGAAADHARVPAAPSRRKCAT